MTPRPIVDVGGSGVDHRRVDLDWLRGFAVLLMILWHAVDAWTIQTGRATLGFAAIIFSAGWVAPMFLFFAGVSLPFAAASRMRRGLDRREAGWALQKRGWQIFLLAHLFRFQSFLLNPNASWSAVLKPDILNILGLGMIAVSACWMLTARSPRAFTLWMLLSAAVIVAMLTPLSRTWTWPALLHPRLEAYIRPVGAYGVFSLFPAVAYVFAGAHLGALIAGKSQRDATFHRRMALAGVAAVTAAAVVAVAPWPLPRVWADVSSVFLYRVGTITVAVFLAWALFRMRPPSPSGPFVVFGRTSLFVYWVHVELAYGVFSYPLHRALTLPWSGAAFLLLTGAMFVCARGWLRRPAGPLIPPHMAAV